MQVHDANLVGFLNDLPRVLHRAVVLGRFRDDLFLRELLGEVDDLPLLVVELEVEAGLVSNAILGRWRSLGGEASPRGWSLAQIGSDFGKHFRLVSLT